MLDNTVTMCGHTLQTGGELDLVCIRQEGHHGDHRDGRGNFWGEL